MDYQADLELISLGEDDTLRVFGAVEGQITGTDDINFSRKSFTIYPNPANNTIYVQSDMLKSNDITGFEIYNMKGRLISTHPAKDIQNGIAVSVLSSGTYLLSVKMKNGNSYGKLFSKQ